MLNINNIIWKIIQKNDHYEISNIGQIRSVDRYVKNSINTERFIKGQYKDTYIRSNTCMYLYVQLYRNNKAYTYAVHRLVAKAFINNPDNKPMVNHLDGNKLNNNACNLEWCTCSENHKHAWATGLHDREQQRERMIGTKYSKDSIYHNVSFDKSRNKWKATMKVKGKMILQKRLDSELAAALYVNDFIILHNLNRPLNIID